ncbi:hypothetical protein ADL35_02555 [Streptomyces sp. NRRL WC-3753]|nr:hypothetical protein ADL35_02555 [Streptomyces sp. NRRL WC-3753]
MALAMSWLTFVGIRGSVGDSERQPSVSIDTGGADAAERRDDEATPNAPGVPSGWGSTEVRVNEAGAAAPAPADSSEGNNPSTASNGRERAVPDGEEAPASAASTAPTPAASQPTPKKKNKAANKAPAAKSRTATAKPDAAPATKGTPETSAPRMNTYVVPKSEIDSYEVEDNEPPSTWDNLGDFLGFLTPFLAALPPSFLPDVPDMPFEPFSEGGHTSQPDKLEKLPSIELPEPVQAEPQSGQPEAFMG